MDVEEWLDRRAEDLNGEWTLARLGGLRHASEKRLLLASLCPSDELRLEHELDNLYTDTAFRVSTMSGAALGYLEPEAARRVYEMQSNCDMVRCFLHSITWHTDARPPAVQLALMRWTLRPRL